MSEWYSAGVTFPSLLRSRLAEEVAAAIAAQRIGWPVAHLGDVELAVGVAVGRSRPACAGCARPCCCSTLLLGDHQGLREHPRALDVVEVAVAVDHVPDRLAREALGQLALQPGPEVRVDGVGEQDAFVGDVDQGPGPAVRHPPDAVLRPAGSCAPERRARPAAGGCRGSGMGRDRQEGELRDRAADNKRSLHRPAPRLRWSTWSPTWRRRGSTGEGGVRRVEREHLRHVAHAAWRRTSPGSALAVLGARTFGGAQRSRIALSAGSMSPSTPGSSSGANEHSLTGVFLKAGQVVPLGALGVGQLRRRTGRGRAARGCSALGPEIMPSLEAMLALLPQDAPGSGSTGVLAGRGRGGRMVGIGVAWRCRSSP